MILYNKIRKTKQETKEININKKEWYKVLNVISLIFLEFLKKIILHLKYKQLFSLFLLFNNIIQRTRIHILFLAKKKKSKGVVDISF